MGDADLLNYCHVHDIHVQVYNVMSLIRSGSEKAPKAYYYLEEVAKELSKDLPMPLTVAQVVQGWLIQHGISIIPGTAKVDRLDENSAISLARIPEMSRNEAEIVAHSIEALLHGQDFEETI